MPSEPPVPSGPQSPGASTPPSPPRPASRRRTWPQRLTISTSGDWAVAGGWLARAKTLLADQPGSSERGWVALTEGMFEANRAKKEAAFQQAVEIGRRTSDADLTFATLSYLGASMVHDDRVEEGMTLLDEALAAVAGGDVEDFIIVEEIFCQMFSACEHAHDVATGRAVDPGRRTDRRAPETPRGERLLPHPLRRHPHRGRSLAGGRRGADRGGPALGARQPDPQGRRAHQAGRPADQAGQVRRGGRAARRPERRRVDPAAGRPAPGARRARARAGPAARAPSSKADPASSACIPLLAHARRPQLACGEDPEPPSPRWLRAPRRTRRRTPAHSSPSPEAGPGTGDAQAWLRDAVDGFTHVQLPLEASLCRLDLARACSETNPEVAIAEARRALKSFEMLEAARDVDARLLC